MTETTTKNHIYTAIRRCENNKILIAISSSVIHSVGPSHMGLSYTDQIVKSPYNLVDSQSQLAKVVDYTVHDCDRLSTKRTLQCTTLCPVRSASFSDCMLGDTYSASHFYDCSLHSGSVVKSCYNNVVTLTLRTVAHPEIKIGLLSELSNAPNQDRVWESE